jgi:hypothetical protein
MRDGNSRRRAEVRPFKNPVFNPFFVPSHGEVTRETEENVERSLHSKSMARSTLFGALWKGVTLLDASAFCIGFDVTQVELSSITAVSINSFLAGQIPPHSTSHGRDTIPRLHGQYSSERKSRVLDLAFLLLRDLVTLGCDCRNRARVKLVAVKTLLISCRVDVIICRTLGCFSRGRCFRWVGFVGHFQFLQGFLFLVSLRFLRFVLFMAIFIFKSFVPVDSSKDEAGFIESRRPLAGVDKGSNT